MLLTSLIGPETIAPPGCDGVRVRSITADSRQVEPGDLFVALAGTRADGARFAADAVDKGAVAILAGEGVGLGALGVPVLRSVEPRRALALMAARLFGRQPETVVAVTGTSGKTSVAEFTRQILAACGCRSASLGTIGVVTSDGADYGSLTTPDPVTLHRTLARLADCGVTHLAMEASSHGLDQHRLDGVRLTAGAFTNLGRDHLDYHPTVEDYLAAKLRLFGDLLPAHAPVVVNMDGARAGDVVAAATARGQRVIETGRRAVAGLRLCCVTREGFAQVLEVDWNGTRRRVRLPLIGGYQVENALVAAGLVLALEVAPPGDVIAGLETLKGVPGRLEVAGDVAGGLAIVDYAHKPEALTAALEACRPFATGKLVVVFGCGGDRDTGKRPIMGRLAVEGADVVIVTDDNPRSEAPGAIRAEILAGAHVAGRAAVREIADRAEAIAAAIDMLGAGDVALIAGKGHETGQIVGDRVLPFCDHEAVRAAIVRRNGEGRAV